MLGGIKFYDRKEVQDVHAYLKVLVNIRDDNSLLRIINYPARGIGKTSLERVIVAASTADVSLWEVLDYF